MRIRFIPLIFIYYSLIHIHEYKYIFTFFSLFFYFFFFVSRLFVLLYYNNICFHLPFPPLRCSYSWRERKRGEGHWMRKTFSLAFAKRRAELRFVIYDLMCCLQKTHSPNSISLRAAAISYLFFQSNYPNLYFI